MKALGGVTAETFGLRLENVLLHECCHWLVEKNRKMFLCCTFHNCQNTIMHDYIQSIPSYPTSPVLKTSSPAAEWSWPKEYPFILVPSSSTRCAVWAWTLDCGKEFMMCKVKQNVRQISRSFDCRVTVQFSPKLSYLISCNVLNHINSKLTHLKAEQPRWCSPVAPSQPQWFGNSTDC